VSLDKDLLRRAAANIQTEAERIYEFYTMDIRKSTATLTRYTHLAKIAKLINDLCTKDTP
jgi:hypothetical protein